DGERERQADEQRRLRHVRPPLCDPAPESRPFVLESRYSGQWYSRAKVGLSGSVTYIAHQGRLSYQARVTGTACNGDRADDRSHATRLECSLEAVQLARRCEIVDLHVDTFIPVRLWRYDVLARHRSA